MGYDLKQNKNKPLQNPKQNKQNILFPSRYYKEILVYVSDASLLLSVNSIDFDGVMLTTVKISFSSNEVATVLTIRWNIASFPVV